MRAMRQFGLTGLALALAASAACAQTATQTPPVESRVAASQETQALVDRYVAEDRTNGIVIGYGGTGAPVFVSAGRIAAEEGAAAADADSLWRVYSMTKPITGIAAMMLVEEGKLELDQPISDFIPGFAEMKVLTDPENSLESRPAARPITVRHLLTHTAGLGYTIVTKGPLLDEYNRLGINPAALNAALEPQMRTIRPDSLEEFANRVATLPLIADPGTSWSYSISLDVLARVIEVAAGMPFERFVQTRLFDPLDMDSTYWTVPQSEVGRFATNYAWAGDNRLPVDPAGSSVWLTPPSFPYGGAGLVMSARNYDRFLHMLLNEGVLDGTRVLKPETVRLAMSNLLPEGVAFGGVAGNTGGTTGPRMGYGAGGSVYLDSVPGGAGAGTYGWGGAAGTAAWVDPTNKVRGVVMVNYFPADKWPLRDDAVRAIYTDMAQ
ncbi:serine hydrolase domain-containing protein [Sphingosinithalassobacter sp. CS137]|uniref:serine hydrolase domain-containing protein n=1 Tax=Sphingosinithalassobacter sp. CS137 TaxID=2762748 RepID=UPI0021D04A7C|nr:serine hydrolase domain-containing protein [Sphingosinithalassobacter sp. CS137]